jgi:hypothetical protein
MNQRQARLEELRYGTNPFVYPGDGQHANTGPRRDDPDFMDRTIHLLEWQSVSSAIKLMKNMAAWSRTRAAGKLRMLVVQYVIFGEPDVNTIAKRMRVSRRRVFQVVREVKCHCRPSLEFHRWQLYKVRILSDL